MIQEAICARQAAVGPLRSDRTRQALSAKDGMGNRAVGREMSRHCLSHWRGGSAVSIQTGAGSSHVSESRSHAGPLGGILEATGGGPYFREGVTFDIAENGFRISAWFHRFVATAPNVSPETFRRRMGPSIVVSAFEFGAPECQVVRTLDDRNALEPLALEHLDDAFRHGDGSVLSYGSEARLDVPLSHSF